MIGAALLVAALVAPAPVAAPGVVVTGVQASTGKVEFFLAGRDLPAGATLSGSTVHVRAGDVELDSSVHEVTGGGSGAPARAVVLVIDASGSMAGKRLRAARAAAADYAGAAPAGVSLGLVTVSDEPTVVLRPTPDRTAFTTAARHIEAGGGTALYDAVAAATDLLDGDQAAKYVERRVVVLSDGADTASRTEPRKLSRVLARAGLTLDAVAFGDSDQAELAMLTEPTGGRVLPAAHGADLRAIFRTMAAGLTAPVVVTATVPPELAGRTDNLRVVVDLPGGPVTADTGPVQLRADPAAQPGPATVRVPAQGSGGLLVVAGAVAAALFAIALLLLLPVLGRSPEQRRLNQLDRFVIGRRATISAGPGDRGSPVLRAAIAVGERAVRNSSRRERIELALDRAGSHLRAGEWLLIRVVAAVAGAVTLGVLLPGGIGVPLGLVAGWLGSAQYLRLRAGRRTRRFADQLPDALHLMVGSLRSGFSLLQSIDALVREGAEPVAGELGRALAETRLGGDLEDALERVGERNGSQDIAWLVMAIRIQREVGGNLSEVLETAVVTMRERARLGRHVRALSAEGRLSAMVLLGMPIVLGGWMFVFRRDYLRPLYTEPMGLAMLCGSVLMVAAGALWLRKLVRVVV